MEAVVAPGMSQLVKGEGWTFDGWGVDLSAINNNDYIPIGSMGWEYLPTFPLECGHVSPNVGK